MFIRRAAIAAAAIAAPLAFAAPAMAQPGIVDCSNPCVGPEQAAAAADPTGAPWTDFFAAFGPWEKVFDPAGDGQGPWEQAFDLTDGVPNDQQGAWEKAFPPAP
jgi:hypothetical protein